MNYTREPIIETVITPRDGCTLVVRNSKGGGHDEYFVDAIEVVSFGHALFFRSQERPKSFLVPVSDYEVLELKETRMVLKNVSSDRSVKIAGGKESVAKVKEEAPQDAVLSESRPAPTQEARPSKRDKRRRGRRGRDRIEPQTETQLEPHETKESVHEASHEPSEDLFRGNEETPNKEGEEVKAPSFISKLFPPPTTLIRDNISRYKPQEPLPSEEIPEELSQEEELPKEDRSEDLPEEE